jgi:hypothetical protein
VKNKIVVLTIFLMMLGSSLSLVYADSGNETAPDPYLGLGTNSTIPDGNTTVPDSNTTIPEGNSTMPDGNSTVPDGNTTIPDSNSTEHNGGNPFNSTVLAFIREQAQNTTQQLTMLFNAEDLSPEVMNSFQHAEQAMQQAEKFEENQTTAAAQQYNRVLKHYRNALQKMQRENPEYLQQILNPVDGNTTGDDFNSTVPENLNETITATQQELVLRFQDIFQSQITAMYENVNDMMGDMDPQDYTKAQNALMKAEKKMLHIQDKINAGAFDEAVAGLENATETLDDEFGDMGDPGASQMLRTLSKLEAKIERMQEKALRKAAMGEDASDIQALITQLRGNKDKTKNEWRNGKNNGHGKPDENQGSNGKGNN